MEKRESKSFRCHLTEHPTPFMAHMVSAVTTNEAQAVLEAFSYHLCSPYQ